jgi:hypothetical protein
MLIFHAMKTIKQPILAAIVFFQALFVLSVGYATLSSGLSSSDLASTGATLTSASWNRLVNGVLELDGRTAALTSTGGNVGIGTPSPGAILDISGNTAAPRITNTNANGYGGINFSENGSQKFGIYQVGSTNSTPIGGPNTVQLWNYANGPMVFGTNNGERMRIDTSGNVGIGTSSPNAAYKLDVNGAINATGLYVNGSAVGGGGIGGLQVITSTAPFVVPAGVTKIKVTVIGGGGGGSWAGGGHGALRYGVLNVTPAQSITCTVGAGGGVGGGGGTTTFSTLSAAGGGASWAGGYSATAGQDSDYGGGGGYSAAGNAGACIIEW